MLWNFFKLKEQSLPTVEGSFCFVLAYGQTKLQFIMFNRFTTLDATLRAKGFQWQRKLFVTMKIQVCLFVRKIQVSVRVYCSCVCCCRTWQYFQTPFFFSFEVFRWGGKLYSTEHFQPCLKLQKGGLDFDVVLRDLQQGKTFSGSHLSVCSQTYIHTGSFQNFQQFRSWFHALFSNTLFLCRKKIVACSVDNFCTYF